MYQLKIAIERRYDSPLSDFVISLRQESVKAEFTPAAPAQPPAEGPKLSKEDMARMKWKPGDVIEP